MLNKNEIKRLILEDKNNSIIAKDDEMDIKNIVCKYIEQPKIFTPEAKEFIENNFKLKAGEKSFNGTLFGINRFEISNDNLIHLDYEKSDYKTYLASRNREYKPYIEDNNYFIVPLGVLALIITKDNKIIVSGRSNYNKNDKLVGGFVDIKDLEGEKINFLSAINREITEEIGNIEIFDTKILGVILSTCFTFIMTTKSKYISEEIIDIYKNNQFEDKYEMENMIFIDNNKKSIESAFSNLELSNSGNIGLKLHLEKNF